MRRTTTKNRYKLVIPPTPAPVMSARSSPRAFGRGIWVGPVWGATGFMLGIAVWHALGFWDFVGKTVLKGDEEERRLSRAEVPGSQPPTLRTTGSVHGPKQIVAGYTPATLKALRACSLAIPTPSGDETVVNPCPSGTPIAVSGRLARKADFGAPAEPEPKQWGFTFRLP